MKVLLLLQTLLTIQSYLCDEPTRHSSKILIKSYPKKVRVPIQKNVQIINPRKYLKSRDVAKDTKKYLIDKKPLYTVFPKISRRDDFLDVPGSQFFYFDSGFGQKTRIKKNLPNIALIRRKRSANATTGIGEQVKKKDVEQTKKLSKTNTHAKTNKHLSNRKSDKGKLSKRTAKVRHSTAGLHNKREPKPKSGNKSNKNNKKAKRTKEQARTGKKKLRRGKRVTNKKTNKRTNKKKLRSGSKRDVKHVKKASRRLIAGKDAMIEDYPYTVSIQKDDDHWCSGALLNPRLVITTANCIWKANRISRMRVRAGSRHVSRGGQLARIQEVMKHPDWSIRKKPDYDVALIYLDRNIRFSDSAHGVDLPNSAMLPPFDDAWVTSWGAERRDGIFETSLNLQVFHSRMIDQAKCNNITQRFGVAVSDNFFCLSQTGRRAPCTRDTGAPAVSDGILWGLASWGIRKLCGTERFPAMFSYLASRSNLDFIINATHQLMADVRFYPYPDRYVARAAETSPAVAVTETPFI